MKDRIEQLVHELFALDPSLRAHEAQVRALLTQLLQSRPDVSVDPAFARSLKERLLAVYPHAVMARPASASWSSFFRPVMAYPLAGIAVIVLIAGLMRGDNAASPLLQGGMVTRSLGSEAFGPLILASGQGSGGGAEVTAKSEGLSSSDQAPPAPSSLAPMMGGMGGGSVETRLAPEVLPVPVVYRYVYRGEPVELPDSASVYRRVSGAGPGIGDLLQSLNLGLVDPASFPNSKVQSLNLLNDDYSIFVNLTEGSININETWKGGIPEMRPLTTRDIPPDPELIAIVDAFIRNHGISREGYGEPFVLKQSYGPFMMDKMDEGEIMEVYIPDVQQVVYPLILNDRSVYEEYGQRTGLTVSVNVRTKKTVGVYNLFTQEYEVSDYPGEQDFGRIQRILEQGGFRNYYPAYEGVRTVEVEVGEPSWGMSRVWQFGNETSPRELFVPALIFEVVKRPADSYLPERLIVPVVKSVLDQPVPQVTPMMPDQVPPDAPVSGPQG